MTRPGILRKEKSFSGVLVPLPVPSSKSPRSLHSGQNGSTSARYSYTDTFDDTGTLQNMPQHSDTFTSPSGASDINTVLSRSVSKDKSHYVGEARVQKVEHFSYHHYQDASCSESHERSKDESETKPDSQLSYSETFESSSLPHDKLHTSQDSAESSRYSTTQSRADLSESGSSGYLDHATASVESKDKHSHSDESRTYSPSFGSSEDKTDASESPEEYSESFEPSDDYSHTSVTTDEYSHTFEHTDEQYSHTFEPADEYSQTFEPTDDYSMVFEPTEEYSSRVEDLEAIQREKELQQETETAKNNFAQVMLAKLHQPKVAVTLRKPVKEDTALKVNENEAKFCRRKIKLLKAKQKYGPSAFTAPQKSVVEQQSKSVVEFGLNPAIAERLKLENIMFSMQKAANEKIHDPRRCRKCRKHAADLAAAEAQKMFIRSKTRKLQSEVIDEKIQSHTIRMNTVSMIGELLQTLPRPSDDPEEIMDRLYDRMKNGPSLHVPYFPSS